VSSDSAACAHVHVAAREWLVCPGGAFRCAGCEDATQTRTVDKARRHIVEAMDLFVADARRARIVDDVKRPSGAAKVLRTYATLRKSADEEERRAACATCRPRHRRVGWAIAPKSDRRRPQPLLNTPITPIVASPSTPLEAHHRPLPTKRTTLAEPTLVLTFFPVPRSPTLRAFAGRRAALVVPPATRTHDRPPDRSTKESAAGLAAG
jgi:hypothetical protein